MQVGRKVGKEVIEWQNAGNNHYDKGMVAHLSGWNLLWVSDTGGICGKLKQNECLVIF